jgi:hypothetical protein
LSALQSSDELRTLVREREQALEAAKAAYASTPKAAKLWDAFDAARSAKERAEFDLQLAITREQAERHAAEQREQAERRTAFDAFAMSATVEYIAAAKLIVAAVVDALAAVDAAIAKLDAIADVQREQAEHAAALAAEFGVRPPAPVMDHERDLLVRVAAAKAKAGERVARVLERPAARRFRRTLSEHARGVEVRDAIERTIAAQEISPVAIGIRELDRDAITRPAWDSPDLPAWQSAEATLAL